MEGDQEAQVGTLNIYAAQFEYITTGKVQLIIKLMQFNGALNNIERNVEQVISRAPAERKGEFKDIFEIEGIIASLIPVYDNYFSEEELKEMIWFYESVVGQKIVEISPMLSKEAMQATLKYFQSKIQQ